MANRKSSSESISDKLGKIDDSQETPEVADAQIAAELLKVELKDVSKELLETNVVDTLLKFAQEHGVSIPRGASKSVIVGKILKEKAALAYSDIHKDKNASKVLPYEKLQYPVRIMNSQQLRELFQNDPNDLINPKLLVRCHIGVNDPSKHAQPSELFATYIRGIGAIRYAVPLQLAPDQAYHVPYAILQMMVGKVYQIHSENKYRKSAEGDQEGNLHKTRLMPTYTITVLPPLDKKALDDIVDSHSVEKSKKA